MERQDMRRFVQHLYDLLGPTVSLRSIERSVGLQANDPALQAYIEELALTDEPYNYLSCIDR